MSEIKDAPEGWDHKDVWRRRGKDFLIEVTRHSVDFVDHWEGPNRWAVYAYIYPKHPHFGVFDGPHIWQDATSVLHLHGGCSFLEYPMYDGKVTSVKVGADYHHLHDDRFTNYATPAEAHEVFSDANELFEQLQNRAETVGTGSQT
jgi:hypothetical protein